MERYQSFLLILAALFLGLLIYVLAISPRTSPRFNLDSFDRTARIILGGDVMLGRSVMTKSLGEKDPSYPFRKIAEETSKADFFFVNLESPVIEKCPLTDEGLIFCALPEMIDGLELAGVDIVNLANNHALNWGVKGLKETVGHLEARGIEAVGMGNLVVKEKRGVTYGFLGFDFVSKVPSEEDWELVRASGPEVDILIVSVHWGAEYQSSANRFQKETAARLVESGADVVFGHHPHWVQDGEKVDSKPVYYSLGNLVFDQMWSEKTREGLLIRLSYKDGELVSEEDLPVYMDSWAQPSFREEK